ncbi:MAG TPA: EAL domain-containing protein [Noviherbaspirillum sp.]
MDIYKIIAEHAIDPIFVADDHGCILYTNPAAERALGYTRDELIGARLHETIHHHHADGTIFPRETCPLHRAQVRGEPLADYLTHYIRKDGSLFAVSCSTAPVSEDGAARCLVFARDATQRVEAERALAASEQRFRLITDSMPQLVWILSPEGEILFVNERFRQYVGEDVRLGADYVARAHPGDLQHMQAVLADALHEGTDYRVEHRIRGIDGNYRWFLSHGVPLKDAHGQVTAWYGSSTDIDEIRRAGDALRRSQETLRLAAEATHLGLWEYYIDTGELVWNDTNRRIYGLPAHGDVTYDMFVERVHAADRERVNKAARSFMHPGYTGRFDAEFRILRKDDDAERWLRVNGQALLDPEGHSRFVGTTLDITDSKTAEQRIRAASQRDPLTGLPNRALLVEYCEHLLAIAQRTKSSGALLFVDLDRFKPINDTHGHDVGDQVLRQVAKRLLACTRQEDVVGRLGGDEFVVALPHPDDLRGPATVAQHIVDRLSEPYHVGNLQLHLSPSIGISLYPRHGENVETLIRHADTAMYEAKRAGRGRYRFYTPDVAQEGEGRAVRLESRLRKALERNELALYYQPVMDVESGDIVGAEALLRLPVSDGEPLVPDQFLPAAESAGMITALGEWVAREACLQHQKWREAGLPTITMAINVSPQQFRQRSFVRDLASSMRRTGMNPGCLQIELTESAVLQDVHNTIAALEELRALGIHVALDDFGVGYSSIGLLSSLPVDKLKIDQSFVSRIGRDAKSRTITDTVLALGHSLNLTVVGEGIESEDVFDYLRGHGCDQAQGYYFSRPLSPDQFERWFRDSVHSTQHIH